MAFNYYNRYIELFDFGKRIQPQFVRMNPQNFYRISRYEYSDGDIKNLAGRDASLVFVIGIFDDKINCIKLNELRPDIFIEWIPRLLKTGLKLNDIDNMEKISDIIVKSDRSGNTLFEEKIKPTIIYSQYPRPYRTYNLDGLKYIQQINLKKEIIKGML